MDWSKHFSSVGADDDSDATSVKANSVARVKGIENVSKANLSALYDAAKTLEIPVDWLATVMSFESGGTFSPNVLNRAGSGAFGLIQFMPSTAAHLLGYPDTAEGRAQAVEEGKAMSFSKQLKKMVIPYLKPFMPFHSLNDVYLAIFYPAAMNKDDSHVVGAAPSAVYTQNQGFDREGKGYITRADITKTIHSVLDSALDYPRIDIIVGFWAQVTAGLALAAAAVLLAVKQQTR